MIEHHKGAVSMAQKEIDNGTNPQALKLAHSMADSQQRQILKMQAMLNRL